MTEQSLLLAEEFPHKLSAQYETLQSAEQAVQQLTEHAQIPRVQINIIQPLDPLIAHKLEPEVKGISQTLVRSHLSLGAAGLLLGLIVALVLVTFGPSLTRSSPLFTFIATCFLCTTGGLLLAGLISLRPDHDPMIAKARTAASTGRWTVVVHCADEAQQSRASQTVEASAQTL